MADAKIKQETLPAPLICIPDGVKNQMYLANSQAISQFEVEVFLLFFFEKKNNLDILKLERLPLFRLLEFLLFFAPCYYKLLTCKY